MTRAKILSGRVVEGGLRVSAQPTAPGVNRARGLGPSGLVAHPNSPPGGTAGGTPRRAALVTPRRQGTPTACPDAAALRQAPCGRWSVPAGGRHVALAARRCPGRQSQSSYPRVAIPSEVCHALGGAARGVHKVAPQLYKASPYIPAKGVAAILRATRWGYGDSEGRQAARENGPTKGSTPGPGDSFNNRKTQRPEARK